MLNMSFCPGNRWLYLLLIVLGGMLPGLAMVVSCQAQTTAPARQADPDNAEQVALGQQVYASFCAGCHGDNLEGQPNWRQRLPLGNFPAPPHDETGHTWHHADQWLFEVVKYGGKYHRSYPYVGIGTILTWRPTPLIPPQRAACSRLQGMTPGCR